MDYPKMLYRHSFNDWKIACDDEHEAELKKDGFMEHNEFMKKDKNGSGQLDDSELLTADDIDAMTKDEIMQALDEAAAQYNKRDSKEKLAAVLKDVKDL